MGPVPEAVLAQRQFCRSRIDAICRAAVSGERTLTEEEADRCAKMARIVTSIDVMVAIHEKHVRAEALRRYLERPRQRPKPKRQAKPKNEKPQRLATEPEEEPDHRRWRDYESAIEEAVLPVPVVAHPKGRTPANHLMGRDIAKIAETIVRRGYRSLNAHKRSRRYEGCW